MTGCAFCSLPVCSRGSSDACTALAGQVTTLPCLCCVLCVVCCVLCVVVCTCLSFVVFEKLTPRNVEMSAAAEPGGFGETVRCLPEILRPAQVTRHPQLSSRRWLIPTRFPVVACDITRIQPARPWFPVQAATRHQRPQVPRRHRSSVRARTSASLQPLLPTSSWLLLHQLRALAWKTGECIVTKCHRTCPVRPFLVCANCL